MPLLLVLKIAYRQKPLTTFLFLGKVKSLANDPIVFFVVYSNNKFLDTIFCEVSVALCSRINLCLGFIECYPIYLIILHELLFIYFLILLSYHINRQVLNRNNLDIKCML